MTLYDPSPSGQPAVSDVLQHTVPGASTTLDTASVPEPRERITLTIHRIEPFGGPTHRVHDRLHNGTDQPILAGVIVSPVASITDLPGDAGTQAYEYHEPVAAGATVPRFPTLELVNKPGSEWTFSVSLLEPDYSLAVQSAPFAFRD